MTLGERIKKLRREKNLSQEKLAEMLDVHLNTVSKWEKGAAPSAKRLTELAKTLHTTADYLLGDTDDPQEHEVPNASAVKLQKISPSSEDYSFTEKLINSNKMIVYETNNGRFFIPATSDGFAFIKNMGAGNFAMAN